MGNKWDYYGMRRDPVPPPPADPPQGQQTGQEPWEASFAAVTMALRLGIVDDGERRALLDALGHSPDCVAPDHYRKVWQDEHERYGDAIDCLHDMTTRFKAERDRAERAERERDEAREALRRYGIHDGGMKPRPNGDGCVLTKGGTWCSCGLEAALSADAEPSRADQLCDRCGHRRDVHEFPNDGPCQAVNGACACPGVPRREPSRLDGDS